MNENEYIAGIWSGHDCSYFIMDHEGQPVVHNELERFNREKEPSGNSLKFLKENFEEYKNIKYLATCWPFYADKIYHGSEAASLVERNEIRDIVESNGGGIHTIGHHESHALKPHSPL